MKPTPPNLQPRPPYWSILGLTALIGGEVIALWFWRQAAGKADARRRAQQPVQIEAPSRASAGFGPGTEAVARRRLESIQLRWGELQLEWADRIAAWERSSVTAPDLVVALVEMRERMSVIAAQAGVRVASEASSFGFATFAQRPPPLEVQPAVERQRRALACLLEILLTSRPIALLAVQREAVSASTSKNPATAAVRTVSAVAAPAERAETFNFDPAVSLRASGALQTAAFRFTFCGETETLRTFLNRLATSVWPIVIRDVEVALATPAEMAPAPADATLTPRAGPSAQPLRPQPGSRFAVTVEWVQSVNSPGEVGT